MRRIPGGSSSGRAATLPGDGAPLTLEFRDITKAFPGQLAVDHVSFSVARSEIHGLVGENGAGKTTLIKCLAGEYHPDEGEILLDGQQVTISHPWESTKLGIGFIHQEPALVPRLSVRENLTLGFGFELTSLYLISWRRQDALARSALEKVGLRVDPRERLENLSLHEQQLVAIARLLLLRGRVVVFDEVTAPLTETEVNRLFALVREMREQGVSIIFISHRLEEIHSLADRVTILKNGAWVATEDVSALTPHKLASLIIGKDPERRFAGDSPAPGRRAVLSVRGLSNRVLSDVSFDLYEGEILGLAGLAGSGRTNVVEAIFGARRPTGGRIFLDDEPFSCRHPADAVRKGVVLVSEDRKRTGFVPNFPVWKNITLPWLGRFTAAGFLNLGHEQHSAAEAMRLFDVRAHSVHTPMRELSGGNQQKAILARWLSQSVRVLLLDEPTHGVDVGAKEQIYGIIRGIAAQGTSVIIVSDELEELEGLCARVLLISKGRILGELTGNDIRKRKMLTALLVGHLTEIAE